MSWFVKFFFQAIGACTLLVALSIGTADCALANGKPAVQQDDKKDVATKVICNVILFVQKLGLPIMTGVILGASVMAVFGRLAWPAIAMLVVFTAIFFGASKLISRFAQGITELDADNFDCK
ncbi:type IV secretion system protein VirB2 [Anaplasma centrale str. Israel]|uniref:Type IV secretion system protein VirB2 n=1 Tax=Anaplasma centrale (strain Israel) TaxID=574556 RepID=D1ATT5_ANACI|nr:TrbC/VirB2 family protein [Anaplasma centrale]ACZ48963.1 type IV secretion system protein VirB2 [Anaplasma centrale str. Israel]